MGVGWLVLLALLAAGVAVAVLLAGRAPATAPGPEDELRMRYARGELDTEEYHARLAVLRWPPDQPVD
jgi:putative membrane protein